MFPNAFLIAACAAVPDTECEATVLGVLSDHAAEAFGTPYEES
jgi:hypothetical protein